MRTSLLLGVLGATTTLLSLTARDARACGGCFHEPPTPTQSGTVVTDHRMIFAVSPAQTTLYDQIKYTGNPSAFAWVLPTHGVVTVGLSSDVLFQAMDQATQTTIVAPTLPQCPSCQCFPRGASLNAGGGSSASSSGGTVNVLSQAVVGPYDTVQLQSTDPTALNTWLTANGFAVPTNVQPIIAQYVKEGFNFLAMKLVPGQGIQSMRPVSVSTPGAGLSLPLRMVAAGTGATVGITLWVVATGRYEPMNFQTFSIAASELTWDWNASSSNYATVRAAKEAKLNNAGWQIESSIDLSPYQVENVVLSGDPTVDYPAPPVAPDGGANPGTGMTPTTVRQQDLATCFPAGLSSVRITRMRGDLSQAALANDLVLQPATNQATMSNFLDVTMSVNAPTCPPYDPSTCNCGGTSSGISSSSGVIGGTTSGGMTKPASSGQESFGCSTAPAESGSSGIELGLFGLIGAALVRAHARKKKS
jgi:MYXO-CTERM domain-containing protein